MKKTALLVAIVMALTAPTAAFAKKKRVKGYQPATAMTDAERHDRIHRFLVTPAPLAIMQFLAAQTKDYN